MKKTKQSSEIFFYILIRSWNAFEYFDRCCNSVLNQTYSHYKILFVDDCSNYTTEQKNYIRKKLTGHVVAFNQTRKYAIRNAYEMIHRYATKDNAIVFNLDCDDYLLTPDALATVAAVYAHKKPLFTYGGCIVFDENKKKAIQPQEFDPYANKPYPTKITTTINVRTLPFHPLHPRTWKVSLFKKIPKKNFFGPTGQWLKFCEDMAIFFPMLEKKPNRYAVIDQPLYMYTYSPKRNDVDSNFLSALKEEVFIRKR
jgi:glycosyltransferase involved in cell wall biosynthesis